VLTLRPARTWLRLADAASGRTLLVPVLLLVGLAYAGNLRNPLFGSDTWPWLASSRVSSLGDVVTLAFSPIMPGTQFLAEVARFYRPLASLSYALDLALFGLNPFALYATNLGIHLLGVGAVYSLARHQDLVVAPLLVGSMSLLVRARVAALPWRSVLVVALGLAWQASFLLLYVAAHTSLSAYLLYVPLVGLAVVVGAILDGAVRLLARLRGPGQLDRVSGGRAGVAAIAAAVFVAGVVRSSALVTAYPEWADAGFVSERFLAQALPCFAAAQGSVAQVADLPYRVDYGTRESTFVDAYVFEPYSLESALRLLLPGTRVGLQVLGQADVHGRPRDVQVTCTPGPGGWRLSPSVTVE